MLVFEFSGFGNFSHSFGWDSGLEMMLGKEVAFNEAVVEDINNMDSDSFAVYGNVLPFYPEEGIYISFSNEHGGSRNVRGWVIAETEGKAWEIMRKFSSDNYPVVYYCGE